MHTSPTTTARIRPSARGIAGWVLIAVGLATAWNGPRLSGMTVLGALIVGAGTLALAGMLSRRSS
jgi:hypothetical protein